MALHKYAIGGRNVRLLYEGDRSGPLQLDCEQPKTIYNGEWTAGSHAVNFRLNSGELPVKKYDDQNMDEGSTVYTN